MIVSLPGKVEMDQPCSNITLFFLKEHLLCQVPRPILRVRNFCSREIEIRWNSSNQQYYDKRK